MARGRLGEHSDGRRAGEASLSLPPAGSLKRPVYSSSSFPLGNWGQDKHVRVRTAVVPPFRKGSREKGDDYFGSLLPSLQLLFGLLLMPAGFSEEVGEKQEGEEEEYKLLGHHPQQAGRAMSRNPHSYGALAIVLLRQLGERGSSQFRQTPLYCSPPEEEKECNTPQPSVSVGTCPAQRTCLTSPPTLVSPSTGEKVSPIRSLGQDE